MGLYAARMLLSQQSGPRTHSMDAGPRLVLSLNCDSTELPIQAIITGQGPGATSANTSRGPPHPGSYQHRRPSLASPCRGDRIGPRKAVFAYAMTRNDRANARCIRRLQTSTGLRLAAQCSTASFLLWSFLTRCAVWRSLPGSKTPTASSCQSSRSTLTY